MFRVLVVAVFFITEGYSQSLKEICDTPLGASREQVLESSRSLGWRACDSLGRYVLSFAAEKEGCHGTVKFAFENDRLVTITVSIGVETYDNTMKAYQQLLKQLSGTYFDSPAKSIRVFDDAVRYGDGGDIYQVVQGRAVIKDIWINEPDAIQLEVTKNGKVQITILRACATNLIDTTISF